jgi:hypothetical protein
MKDILDWCDNIQAESYLSPKEIDNRTVELLALGWRIKEWGESKNGKRIISFSWGEGPRCLSAYGYPHPDEPLGATALMSFAKAVGFNGPPFQDTRFEIILQADPDGALQNQSWVENPSLDNYFAFNWHPYYLGWEVDYAFPIDYGPFFQPASRQPLQKHAPLPESLALARWLKATKPGVLGLMHNEHVSGGYQFLVHRPSRSLVAGFDQINQCFGIPIHRGERPDPGERWIKARPDFLKERSLAHRQRLLERQVGPVEDRRYLGCVSVAQYLESLDAKAEVLTPEVGLWYREGIDDSSITGAVRETTVTRELTRRGMRIIQRGNLTLPDGSEKRVCYHIQPDDPNAKTGKFIFPATRGMLGVEAIEHRRWFLAQADHIWLKAEEYLTLESPRRSEREAIRVPSSQVKDRAMLIFRTASQYLQLASVAHQADFEARWAFHTARLLGWNEQLYREQGIDWAWKAQYELRAHCQDSLPPLKLTPASNASKSMIARWLLTGQEHYRKSL